MKNTGDQFDLMRLVFEVESVTELALNYQQQTIYVFKGQYLLHGNMNKVSLHMIALAGPPCPFTTLACKLYSKEGRGWGGY